MKILLDTSFVVVCVKENIDFISLADEMFDEPITWVLPKEVEKELRDISVRKGEKIKDKDAAKIGLQILESVAEKISLENKVTDNGIVNYAKSHEVIVATLDKELKKRVRGKVLTIRGKKGLDIV